MSLVSRLYSAPRLALRWLLRLDQPVPALNEYEIAAEVQIPVTFAQGIPVVSTTLGCEGIDAVDGEHLLLADTPEAFCEAVVRVIQDPSLAERLTGNARQLAESRYSWHTVYASLDAVYERIATLRSGVSDL